MVRAPRPPAPVAERRRLVDLLHARALVHVLLEGGHVALVVLLEVIVLVDAEAELDHAVDAGAEGVGVVEREARGEHGGLEQQEHEILDGLVALVRVAALLELRHDGVVGVDLHGLLRGHVAAHGVVAEGLGLHDALHVGGPPVLARHQHAGGVHDAVAHQHLLHLVPEHVLHEAAEPLERRLLLLLLLLLLLRLLQRQPLLGGAHQLLAIVLLELLHGVLVDRVHHEEHLDALLLQHLEEGGVLHGLLALARDVVDVLLALLHAGHVVLEGGLLLARLGGVVAEEVRELGAVLRVLVDAELEVLAERLVELGVVVLVLGNLGEHLQALLHDVLLDDLEDLVLLEHLAGDVEGEILGVDDALDEGQPLGDDLLAVVHDEHAADVELDVVALLLAVEEVEGRALGGKEHGLELELALHREVLDREVLLPIIGERLVEGGVLVLGDLVGVAHPDGLLLVHELPLVADLLDLLGLLLLLLIGDLLDLALLVLALLGLLLLVVGDLLLGGLLGPQGDGVGDELGVLLDEVLEAALLEVLELVLLHVEHDLAPALDLLVLGLGDGEGAAGVGLPDVAHIVIVLGSDDDLLGHEVGRVEADAELADHGDVRASGESLHEGLGAGAGDGAEIVDEISLGHADAGVLDGQGVVGLVGHNVDEQLGLGIELALVGQALEADLVERIGGVRDELAEEDLLVGVEGVDNQRQELVNLRLESERLRKR
mmetsp:Transcript_17764/g.57462  ORF Transcript_17764/g.57462 Transcript_17764/m.57462 type:complete len:716 (-) Transcript_17764:251-2398(-)